MAYTEKSPDEPKKKTTKAEKQVEEAPKPEYVTKVELSEFARDLKESLLTIFTPKRVEEIRNETIAQNKPFMMEEIKDQRDGIERISDRLDFSSDAELQAFMEEYVVIEIDIPSNQEEHEICVPSVNGINQPILRGVPSKVKRKYVEALARCKYTEYKQVETDKTDPTKRKMIPITMMSYPFRVLQDSKKGYDWFKLLKQEAN